MFKIEYVDHSKTDSDKMSWGYVDMPNVAKMSLVVGDTVYDLEKPKDWVSWIYFKEGTVIGLKGGRQPFDSGEAIGYSNGITEHVLFYDMLTKQLENREYPHGTHIWHSAK